MKTKVLVIGSRTFLGTSVVELLKKKRRAYACIKEPNHMLTTAANATRALKLTKPHIIINCGIDTGGIAYVQKYPADILNNNVNAHMHLLEAAHRAGVHKLVNVISNSSYPSTERKKLSENEWWSGPIGESALAVGASSKILWLGARMYYLQYGLESANLIVSNLYGPGDEFDAEKSYAANALVYRMLQAQSRNERTVTVWGTGKAVRDWLYVTDAAEALLVAASKKTGIDPINIGTGRGISIRTLAQTIRRATAFRGKIVFDRTKPDGAARKILDTKRSKQLLQWRARTSLTTGIEQTVTWYQALLRN